LRTPHISSSSCVRRSLWTRCCASLNQSICRRAGDELVSDIDAVAGRAVDPGTRSRG
jgi:hypothetical protein